jgi:hypothetical protein
MPEIRMNSLKSLAINWGPLSEMTRSVTASPQAGASASSTAPARLVFCNLDLVSRLRRPLSINCLFCFWLFASVNGQYNFGTRVVLGRWARVTQGRSAEVTRSESGTGNGNEIRVPEFDPKPHFVVANRYLGLTKLRRAAFTLR